MDWYDGKNLSSSCLSQVQISDHHVKRGHPSKTGQKIGLAYQNCNESWSALFLCTLEISWEVSKLISILSVLKNWGLQCCQKTIYNWFLKDNITVVKNLSKSLVLKDCVSEASCVCLPLKSNCSHSRKWTILTWKFKLLTNRISNETFFEIWKPVWILTRSEIKLITKDAVSWLH